MSNWTDITPLHPGLYELDLLALIGGPNIEVRDVFLSHNRDVWVVTLAVELDRGRHQGAGEIHDPRVHLDHQPGAF